MNIIKHTYHRIFPSHRPLPAGIFQFHTPPESPQQYRLHLRLEPNGEGILILNARTVMHLNQTAAEYAYHLVNSSSQEDAVKAIVGRYRVSSTLAREDYANFRQRIETLIHTPDLDPVTFLDFERREPYSKDITAPYRLDCALTYKVSDGTSEQVAPVDRVRRELLTAEWQTILDKAWGAGIPHVVFTGGEPTIRPDLADLISYTEKLGMVSGLLSDGKRLAATKYLHSLLQSGLDHLLLLLDPKEAVSWEALVDVLAEDLFVTVHLTITPENGGEINSHLDRLAEMGVKSISLSASDRDLNTTLQAARHYVAQKNMSLEWDLPVPYSAQHPVAMELEENEVPKGAGQAWMYVEPDGDVLPAQGVNHVCGNLLSEPWVKIWQNRPLA